MVAPRSNVWELELHTRAKHEILRRYLQAWVPILSRGGFPQFLYIDGFAGPGFYSKGEQGSPVIALQAALDHKNSIKSTLFFQFIEKDKERAKVLEKVLDSIERPKNFRVKIDSGVTFENAFRDLSTFYKNRNRRFPPTFAFIDPFGWKGVPFSIVKEILGNRNCEVFVNFMYEEINRFIGRPDQEENFDSFFGTPDWREGIELASAKERYRFFHDLYYRQLKNSAGAKYVRSFQMRNRNDSIDYYLFYATNDLTGLKKMKAAMWTVDETGEFSFSDATDPKQITFFSGEPRYDELKKLILDRFEGTETTVSEIEYFVVVETPFCESHYKTKVLRKIEALNPSPITIVDPPPKRIKGTYADPKLRISFK